ncbi:hypothetical protein TIFTF001_036690 [Ficus carica]|uniref:Uncharacterized protein n=1 Tax=Ficus carica TaxID=3494 RepID=A0AA88E3W7_FICCA|nr:hypothetical protein TIFTF001_036690 [Ficus carica]
MSVTCCRVSLERQTKNLGQPVSSLLTILDARPWSLARLTVKLQSRLVRPEEKVVTIVPPMPNPAVHYRARIVVTVDGACSIFGRSEVPWGVPTTSASGLQFGAQSHFNRMDNKVTELVTEVKRWRDAKKVVVRKAKKAEEQAFKAEEARKKAESELVSAQSEHSCYLQKVLLATFDQARQQAITTTRTPRSLKPVSSPNTRRG